VSESEVESADHPGNRPVEERDTAGGWHGGTGLLAKVVVGTAVLGWSYAPNFRELAQRWAQDPDYSHGYLVIPVALAILWRRHATATAARSAPSWWGWLVVIAALAARVILYEKGKNWLETFTMLPVIAGLVIALGGWSLLARAWPAIAYLGFMFPLPPGLNTWLSHPLQRLATQGSCALLRLTGLWVIAEGNVIDMGDSRLEVATACNGLSMLMCLAATVAAMVLLVSMSRWRRFLLLASIIPIALLSNILRITATGWCYHLLGAGKGADFAHDAAGWLMMPTALLLVGLEMALLSCFFVEVEEEDGRRALDPLLLVRTAPVMPQARQGGPEMGAAGGPATGPVGLENETR
jgi:exosortase